MDGDSGMFWTDFNLGSRSITFFAIDEEVTIALRVEETNFGNMRNWTVKILFINFIFDP